jgi:integrase
MYDLDRPSVKSRVKGRASYRVKDGNLQLVLPRELFGGKQKFMAMGLKNTPEGIAEADRRLRAIQGDIDLGQFDPTLERYKKAQQKQEYLKVVRTLYPDTSLLDLWDKYTEYKRSIVKESTMENFKRVRKHLLKIGVDCPYKALDIRSALLSGTKLKEARRTLVQLNAAFNWGIKHRLVKAPNPYMGMANEIEIPTDDEPIPNAFTPEEKSAVLEAFASHTGNVTVGGNNTCGYGYDYYFRFVQFLLLTGCRPGEAVGLTWKQVSSDYRKITFNCSIYNAPSGKKINSHRSKTNRVRTFPCNNELQALLKSLEKSDPDALVFPSPKGTSIGYNNFSSRAWNKVVDPIKQGTTPYSCRDTFITEQIGKGVPIALVAKWVDNSVAVIERCYLDKTAIAHIMPL